MHQRGCLCDFDAAPVRHTDPFWLNAKAAVLAVLNFRDASRAAGGNAVTDVPSGVVPPIPEHYAYCKNADCPGCLPSDDDLAAMPVIALWGEMLARCIAQTPETKSHTGALAALIADGPEYREASLRLRKVNHAG
jgi:hypothetical protein